MTIATVSLLILAAADPGVGPVEIDAQKIEVTGTGHDLRIDCKGRALIVEGTENVVTASGTCRSVNMTGADNSVVAGIAPGGSLTVNGTGQKVRWSSTGDIRRAVNGIGNSVVRAK